MIQLCTAAIMDMGKAIPAAATAAAVITHKPIKINHLLSKDASLV